VKSKGDKMKHQKEELEDPEAGALNGIAVDRLIIQMTVKYTLLAIQKRETATIVSRIIDFSPLE